MNMAFGISSDDVLAVTMRRGLDISDGQAQDWFDQLDHDAIEGAALHGMDMDEQTDYAFDEIERQLESLGHIPAKATNSRSSKP